MAFPDRRTLDILLTCLALAVICVAIYAARDVIFLFIFAIFFAYLVNPAVEFLQRHALFFRDLRGPAVVEVYLALIIMIAALGHAFAPNVAKHTVEAVDAVPTYLTEISTGDIAADLGGRYGWSDRQEARVREFLLHHKMDVEQVSRWLDVYLSHTAGILGLLVLVPILAIFFLRDGGRIAEFFMRVLFRPASQPRIRIIARGLHEMLARFIRAQVTLCSLSFLFYSASMLLLGVPHPIPLAVMGGALEFVPTFGWLSTAAVMIGVGILNHTHWLWLAALLAVWRIAQDYFISPKILGDSLRIHPLAAIFAVLAGFQLGGIAGVYLAIPVVASMRVIWSVYWNSEGDDSAGTVDHVPLPSGRAVSVEAYSST